MIVKIRLIGLKEDRFVCDHDVVLNFITISCAGWERQFLLLLLLEFAKGWVGLVGLF